MSSFSPSDAAFEGFRLTRERPRVVVGWWLAYFAFSLAITLAALAAIGPQVAVMQAVNQGDKVSAEVTAAALSKIAPFLTLAVPVEVLFFAVLNCAVYRAILRPQERGLGYFRLGADEARMAVLAIVLFFLWLAVIFVVSMIVGVTAGVLGVFGGAATALLGLVIGIAAVAVAVWAFVRLSLAAPMTFQERRVVVFSSWSLTKGRFWVLFGAYLLAFILGVITFLLMAMVSSALVAIAILVTGGGVSGLTRGLGADVSSVSAFVTVPTLLSQALYAAMMTAFYVINLSPSAIAYQALAGPRPAPDA